MACAYGETAGDCAVLHWSPPLGAKRERSAWRADCPMCGADRSLEFDIAGKGIRWNSFCPDHPKATLRPELRNLLKGCLGGKASIDPAEIEELALAKMPPTSLRLALLELAGMSTPEALDKLGVRREHRSRVISGRAPKLVHRRR